LRKLGCQVEWISQMAAYGHAIARIYIIATAEGVQSSAIYDGVRYGLREEADARWPTVPEDREGARGFRPEVKGGDWCWGNVRAFGQGYYGRYDFEGAAEVLGVNRAGFPETRFQ